MCAQCTLSCWVCKPFGACIAALKAHITVSNRILLLQNGCRKFVGFVHGWFIILCARCTETDTDGDRRRASKRGNEKFVKFTCEFQLHGAHVTKSISPPKAKRNEWMNSTTTTTTTKIHTHTISRRQRRYFPWNCLPLEIQEPKSQNIII